MKGDFLQDQAQLCALSELQQDQAHGSTLLMPQQAQPFGFQLVLGGFYGQFRQPFRAQEAARNRSSGLQQSSRRARGVFLLAGPPGK